MHAFIPLAVCPDCYQQLQMYANITRNTLDVINTMVSQLSVMSSPFEDRLLQNQSEVQTTLTSAQQFEVQHTQFVNQFNILSTSMLTMQLMQINTSLATLQVTSTPVFVLARTAEELMNRTIEEILAASEVVNTLSTIILPSAQESAALVSNNSVVANSTAMSLQTQFSLLTSQVIQLENLSDSIAAISMPFLTDTQNLQELHDDTRSTIMDLQNNITFAQNAISTLMPQLTSLAMSVSRLVTCVDEQLQNLASIPPINEVNSTLSNVSTTASYANTLMNESTMQSNRLAELTASIGLNRQLIAPLLQQISVINDNVTNLLSQTENADAVTSVAVNMTEAAINNTRFVLTNLQNFSDDTLAVSSAANNALSSIGMIYATVTNALNQAREIESNIELLRQNTSLTKTVAVQTHSEIQKAELVR